MREVHTRTNKTNSIVRIVSSNPFSSPLTPSPAYKIQNRKCFFILGEKQEEVEGHNPVQLNSTSAPTSSLSLILKNTLCKIHVFYVLTCCLCLQQDPFYFGYCIRELLRKLKKWLSVEIYLSIYIQVLIPFICVCIYCF